LALGEFCEVQVLRPVALIEAKNSESKGEAPHGHRPTLTTAAASRITRRLEGVDACVLSFCFEQANDQSGSQRDAPRVATNQKPRAFWLASDSRQSPWSSLSPVARGS
jgi:hypothetical protein